MSKFKEFFEHEDKDIAFIAGKLAEYEDAVHSGKMDKDEFEELANDLIEFGHIDNLADSIERQVMYKKAFDAMKSIIGVITAL